MEVSLPAGRVSIYGKTSFKGTTQLNIKPFFGFFYSKPKPISQLSQSRSRHISNRPNVVPNPICCTSDFSRRRKPRKVSTARSRGAGKGFMPKPPAGDGTQKKGRLTREKARSASSSPRRNRRGAGGVRVDSNTAGTSGVSEGLRNEEEKDGVSGKTGKSFTESEPRSTVVDTDLKENGSIRGVGDSPSTTISIAEQAEKDADTARVHTGVEGTDGTRAYAPLGSDIDLDAEHNVSAHKRVISENEVGTSLAWKRPESTEGSGSKKIVETDEIRKTKENARERELIAWNESPVLTRTLGADDGNGNVTIQLDKTEEANGTVGTMQLASETEALPASFVVRQDEVDSNTRKTRDDEIDDLGRAENNVKAKVLKYEMSSSDIVAGKLEEMSFGSQVLNTMMDVPEHEESHADHFEHDNLTSTSAASKEADKDTSSTSVFEDFESVVLTSGASEAADKSSAVGDKESETIEAADIMADELRDEQELSQALALKSEREDLLRKQVIEELAKDNFLRENKLFTYPVAVKPDREIEVFLHRSLSTLKHEPDVMIRGAFNDWRWKSFTIRLNKSHLSGDWWSCSLYVPKQAYGIDFVFFNGKDVYDNNDGKDFHISVEGGMDAGAFEDFLLEEKRKELEKLAKEQAERERQEEENRRLAEENAAKEADRAQAKLEIQRKCENLLDLLNKATKSADNLWYFEPNNFKDKDFVRLFYNRSSGLLASANDIWIHGGHNGWKDGVSIVAKLVKSERMDADWWYAEVTVPDGALILDWVFADGPPRNAHRYDNNQRHDFHAVVPKALPDEQYWVEEEKRIYQKLREERRQRELAMRAKAEKTARVKAETKQKTLKRFLLSQKHIFYTDPLDVQAGSPVTIFYNPSNTVLNGKPEIWFRCSFNRWTHGNGSLPPQRMVPAENCSHFKATVKVPLDSYVMDFVFSEREDGGIFDNKDGMDYHVPVHGGVTREPPMHIMHIAVEMAPIAKVGGLGDVVTSLSRAVRDLNHHVDIILPKYDCLNLSQVRDLHYHKSFAWGGTEIKVWLGKVEGLPVYFLDPQNGFFWKGCVYGCANDAQRFGFFCHAALEFLHQTGSYPDIIHCHDWSSAPVAWLYKDHYRQYAPNKARIVFTIHNLEFGAPLIAKAMQYSDKATTVSHTYSKEVATNSVIAPHLFKFHGILNGIDQDIWDPYNDEFIPVTYTSENVIEGKRAAKETLQRRLGLKVADVPVVGIISRLTHQKGIHLIKHAIWRTIERNGQAVLLGSAPDPRIQNDFVNLANQLHNSHNDRARFCLNYDEPLSHLIYAGADFIIVPSIFEPCGLTQLVAMRYGAIPVVRKTGGLYDTVFDVDHDKDRAEALGLEPNGFSFEGADASGVDYALNRGISTWYDNREWFNSLCQRVMEQDWSWNRPALDYLELYHAARKY